MLERIHENNKEEKNALICYDTLLTAIIFKANSFYEDKIESINELNLNSNKINKKGKYNNITSFIKRIQFIKNKLILLLFILILPPIQIISNYNKFPSTYLKLPSIVLTNRRIEYNNNENLFSFIRKNIFYNKHSINDDFYKIIRTKFISFKMNNFYIYYNRKKFNEKYDIINPFLTYVEEFEFDFYYIPDSFYQKKFNGYKFSSFNNSYYEMILYLITFIIIIMINDLLKIKLFKAYVNEKALLEIKVIKRIINNYKNRFNEIKRELQNNSSEKIKIENNHYKKKKELNYKEKNRKIINFICLLIMINLIMQVLSINKIYLIEYKYSNVTLKIKGKGIKNIYDVSFFKDYPNEVFINGNKQNEIKNEYNFVEEETTVKLVWYDNIVYGACIFCHCPDIAELDFSDFDTSDMTYMWWMFWQDNTITSLDLSHFDTSKVENMENMFDGCSSLQYINMKNFYTPELTTTTSMFANTRKCCSLYK